MRRFCNPQKRTALRGSVVAGHPASYSELISEGKAQMSLSVQSQIAQGAWGRPVSLCGL